MIVVMRSAPAFLLLVLTFAAMPAHAAEAPFERSLMRLAEILGSLHFLRELCAPPDGQVPDWRVEMDTLLSAEKPDPARRARLVGSFNSGYRAFAATYSTCTPSATAAIALYLKEGDALTRDVTSRFGN